MDSSQQEPPAASPSPKVRTRKRIAARRCKWLTLTWLLTWWIPSIFLYYCGRMKLRAVREAWREKVAICILIFLASCSLLFLLIGFGPVICPKQAVYSAAEVNGMQDKSRPLVYAYGRVFSVSSLLATHETGYGIQSYQFDALLGSDVSNLFYKHNLFKQYCPGLPSPSPSWDSLANRPKTVAYSHKAIDPSTGVQKMYLEFMNQYAVARIVWPLSYIAKVASAKNKIIVIGRNVYDVNSYFNSNIEFLGPSVKALFANFYGKDATAQWMQIARQNPQQADSYLNCMNNLFYIGTLDQRESFQCQAQDYVLLSFTSILCVVIVAKFIAAIRFVGESSPEKFENFVIINIPVYSEGVDSIQGTLESIANTDYEHSKKLLFIIADGMVTGSGNDRPTFQVLMDILGVEGSLDSYPAFQYESLGEDKDMVNRAVVISGFYTPSESKCLPFIAVVKVGNEDEIGPSAGNRGKRDSQLILLRFLSRCHFEDFMSPLEICIRSKLQNDLDVDPNQLEFLLMVCFLNPISLFNLACRFRLMQTLQWSLIPSIKWSQLWFTTKR
jgi:chitin synthase